MCSGCAVPPTALQASNVLKVYSSDGPIAAGNLHSGGYGRKPKPKYGPTLDFTQSLETVTWTCQNNALFVIEAWNSAIYYLYSINILIKMICIAIRIRSAPIVIHFTREALNQNQTRSNPGISKLFNQAKNLGPSTVKYSCHILLFQVQKNHLVC